MAAYAALKQCIDVQVTHPYHHECRLLNCTKNTLDGSCKNTAAVLFKTKLHYALLVTCPQGESHRNKEIVERCCHT